MHCSFIRWPTQGATTQRFIHKRAAGTCVVLSRHGVQQLLPLQRGGVVHQVGHRGGDAGRGVALDARTGGAEHGGEGGAIGRVQQGAVVVG